MTKKEFREYIRENAIVSSMGPPEQTYGSRNADRVCPEAWVMEHPQDVLYDLQSAYVKNGTNIVYAPTFTGNRIKLEEYGLEDRKLRR